MGVLKFYIPELWISQDTDVIIDHLLKDIENAGLLDHISSIQRYKDHIELLIPDDVIAKFYTLNIDIEGVKFHFISKEEKILIINIYGLELDAKWTNIVQGISKFGQPVRYLEHKKTYNGRTLKTGVRSIWIKRGTLLPGIISDKMSGQGEDIECIELGKEELECIDLGRVTTKLEEEPVTDLEEKTIESSNSITGDKKQCLKADKKFVDKVASKIPRAQSLNSCDRVSRTKGVTTTTKIPRAYSLNSADKISRVSSLAVKKVPRTSSLTTADRSLKVSDKIPRAKSLTSADRKSIRFAKPVQKTNGISVKAENDSQSKSPASPTENLEMDCIEKILKRTESVKNKLKTVKSTVRALPVKRVESVHKMPPKNATITKQNVDRKDIDSKIPTKVAKPIRNPSKRILDSTKNHVARLKQQKLKKEEEERLLREEELAKKRPRLPKRTKSLRNVDRKTLKVNQKKPKLTKTGNGSKEVEKGGKTGVSKEGEKKGRKRWELGGTSKTNSNESLIKKVEGSDSAVESGEQTTDTACTAEEQTKLKAKIKKRGSNAHNKESFKKKKCTEDKKKVKIDETDNSRPEILDVKTNEIKVIVADEVLQGKNDSRNTETTNKTENKESITKNKDVEEQGEYIEVLTEEERMRLINKRKMIDLRVKQWIESCENVISSEKVDESGNVRSMEEAGVIHIEVDENLEFAEETQKSLETNQIDESEITHGGDNLDDERKEKLSKPPLQEEIASDILHKEKKDLSEEVLDVHPMIKGSRVTFDLNDSYIEAPGGDNQFIKDENVSSQYEDKVMREDMGNDSIKSDGDLDLNERQLDVYDGDNLKYEGEIETDELLDKVKEALGKIEHDNRYNTYLLDAEKESGFEKTEKLLGTESMEGRKNHVFDADKQAEYVEVEKNEKPTNNIRLFNEDKDFPNVNNQFVNKNKDYLFEHKEAIKQLQHETISRIINHESIMKKKQMPNLTLNTSRERDEQERVFDSSRESGIETEEENLKTSESDQETYQPESNYINNNEIFNEDFPDRDRNNNGVYHEGFTERDTIGAQLLEEKATKNGMITVLESNDFEVTTEESEFENNEETEQETENETCLSSDYVNTDLDIVSQKHIHKSDVTIKEYELQSTEETNDESGTDVRSDDDSCSESEAGTYNIEDRNHEEKEVSHSEDENGIIYPQEEPNSSPIVLLSYKQLSIEIPDKPLTNNDIGGNNRIRKHQSSNNLDDCKAQNEKDDLEPVIKEIKHNSSEICFKQLEIEIPENSFINERLSNSDLVDNDLQSKKLEIGIAEDSFIDNRQSNHDLENNDVQRKEDEIVKNEEQQSSCERSITSEEDKGHFDLVDAMSKSTGSSMQTIILTNDKENVVDDSEIKIENEREIESIENIEETSEKQNMITTKESSDVKEEENSNKNSTREIKFSIKTEKEENAEIGETEVAESRCQNEMEESDLDTEKKKNVLNRDFRRWSHDERYTTHNDIDEDNESFAGYKQHANDQNFKRFSNNNDFAMDMRNDDFISNKGILSVETINFHESNHQSKRRNENWADFSILNESDEENGDEHLAIEAQSEEELKGDGNTEDEKKSNNEGDSTKEDNKEETNGWADFSVFNHQKTKIDPIEEEIVEEMTKHTGDVSKEEIVEEIQDQEPLFTSAGRELKINDLSSDIVSLLDGKGSFKNLNTNGNTRSGSDGIINHAPLAGKKVQNWADFSVLNDKNIEDNLLEDDKKKEKDFSASNSEKLKQTSDQNHEKHLSKEQIKVSHLLAEVSEKLEKIKTAEMKKLKEERSGDMNIFKDGINFNIPIHNFEIEEEIFREVEEGLSAAEKLKLCQDQLLGNDKEETEDKNDNEKKVKEEKCVPVTHSIEQNENKLEIKEEPELYLRLKKELKWIENGVNKDISRNYHHSEIRTERKIPEQKIDYRTSFDDAWMKSSKPITNDSESSHLKEWHEQSNKKEPQIDTIDKDFQMAEKKNRSRTKTSFNDAWCKGKLTDWGFQPTVPQEDKDVSVEKEIQISSSEKSSNSFSEMKMVEMKNEANKSFSEAWNKDIGTERNFKSSQPIELNGNVISSGVNEMQIAYSKELSTSDTKTAENKFRRNTSFNDAWNGNKGIKNDSKSFLSSNLKDEIILPNKEETQVTFNKELLSDFSETKMIKNRNSAHTSFNDAWNRNKETMSDFEKKNPSELDENEEKAQKDSSKELTSDSIERKIVENMKGTSFNDAWNNNRMAESNYKGYCPSVLNGNIVESDQKKVQPQLTDSSEMKMVKKSAVSLSNESNKNIQKIEEVAKDIDSGKLGIESDNGHLKSRSTENKDAGKHDDSSNTKKTSKKKDDKMKMGIRIRINQKDGAKENNLGIVKFHTDILKNVEEIFKNASREEKRDEVEPSEDHKRELIEKELKDYFSNNSAGNKWNISVENREGYDEINETGKNFESLRQIKPVIKSKPRIAKPVTKPYEKTKTNEEDERALIRKDEKHETEESDDDIVERLKFNFNIDFETEGPEKPKRSSCDGSRDKTKTKRRSSAEKKKKKGFDKFEIDLNISANKGKTNRRSKTEENCDISSAYLKKQKPFDLSGLKVDINKVKSVFENSKMKNMNEEERANTLCVKNKKKEEGQSNISANESLLNTNNHTESKTTSTLGANVYEKTNQMNDLEMPNIEKKTLTQKIRQSCITSKHIESYSLERRRQDNSDIKDDLRQADNRSKLARQAEDVLKEKGIIQCHMNKVSEKSTVDSKINKSRWFEDDIKKNGTIIGKERQYDYSSVDNSVMKCSELKKSSGIHRKKSFEDDTRRMTRRKLCDEVGNDVIKEKRRCERYRINRKNADRRRTITIGEILFDQTDLTKERNRLKEEIRSCKMIEDKLKTDDSSNKTQINTDDTKNNEPKINANKENEGHYDCNDSNEINKYGSCRRRTKTSGDAEYESSSDYNIVRNINGVYVDEGVFKKLSTQQLQQNEHGDQRENDSRVSYLNENEDFRLKDDTLNDNLAILRKNKGSRKGYQVIRRESNPSRIMQINKDEEPRSSKIQRETKTTTITETEHEEKSENDINKEQEYQAKTEEGRKSDSQEKKEEQNEKISLQPCLEIKDTKQIEQKHNLTKPTERVIMENRKLSGRRRTKTETQEYKNENFCNETEKIEEQRHKTASNFNLNSLTYPEKSRRVRSKTDYSERIITKNFETTNNEQFETNNEKNNRKRKNVVTNDGTKNDSKNRNEENSAGTAIIKMAYNMLKQVDAKKEGDFCVSDVIKTCALATMNKRRTIGTRVKPDSRKCSDKSSVTKSPKKALTEPNDNGYFSEKSNNNRSSNESTMSENLNNNSDMSLNSDKQVLSDACFETCEKDVFKCNLCSKEFTTPDYVNKHFQRSHRQNEAKYKDETLAAEMNESNINFELNWLDNAKPAA